METKSVVTLHRMGGGYVSRFIYFGQRIGISNKKYFNDIFKKPKFCSKFEAEKFCI